MDPIRIYLESLGMNYEESYRLLPDRIDMPPFLEEMINPSEEDRNAAPILDQIQYQGFDLERDFYFVNTGDGSADFEIKVSQVVTVYFLFNGMIFSSSDSDILESAEEYRESVTNDHYL